MVALRLQLPLNRAAKPTSAVASIGRAFFAASPRVGRRRLLTGFLLPLLALACDDGPTEPRSDVASIFLPDSSIAIAAGREVPVLPYGSSELDADSLLFRPLLVVLLHDSESRPLAEPLRASSSDPTVAVAEPRASGGAWIRALKPGTATITFEAGAGSANLAVSVQRPYSLTILGADDATSSAAHAINNAGRVVGFTAEPGGASRAIAWDNGSSRLLPRREGAEATGSDAAFAINDVGLIGGVSDGHAVLWSGSSSVEDFWSTERPVVGVNDINEAGDLVAYSPFGMGGRRGWVRIGGEFTELPLYDARAINEHGVVAGVAASVRSHSSAALWSNGEITLLADCSGGGLLCRAEDLNDEGLVVGNVVGVGKWEDGEYVALEEAYPSSGSALAVNNRGEILIFQGTPGLRLALWDESRVINVNGLHAAPDWVLTGAADINDAGQIVGTATHLRTGALKAVLLTPPGGTP